MEKPAKAISMLGVFVLPPARKMALPVIMHTISRLPGSQTTMNSRISTSMSSPAPSRRNISSRKIQHTTIIRLAMTAEM